MPRKVNVWAQRPYSFNRRYGEADITILTRLKTYREIVKIKKQDAGHYNAEISWFGGHPAADYVKTVSILIQSIKMPATAAPLHAKHFEIGGQKDIAPSQAQTQTCAPGASCAQSSGQTGGITAGQINIVPAERHLTPLQKAVIADFVRGKQCKINMLRALINVPDAQNYALEIAKAFRDGGCDAPKECNLGTIPGGARHGIEVTFHDDAIHRDGEKVFVHNGTPEGVITGAFDHAKIPIFVNTTGEKGIVSLLIGAP